MSKPHEAGIAFTFVEGSLVRAIREGRWLLLDEINLAAPETLERVTAALGRAHSMCMPTHAHARDRTVDAFVDAGAAAAAARVRYTRRHTGHCKTAFSVLVCNLHTD